MILKTVKLSEVSAVVDSLHKSPQYSEFGFPMVRVTDVKRGYLDVSGCNYVSEDVFKEFNRKYTPKSGDIIMTRVGTYGVSALVGECGSFCLGQNTVVIEPKKIESRLLYHFLQSSFVRNQIEQQVVGSTQKTLSLKAINDLEIPVFDKATEEYISKTLSAIDDKIHINNQINETLESIAKTIFKEWFIDFDPVKAKAEGKKPFGMDDETAALFPGSFEDSGIGPIPKGWELRPITDLFEVNPKYSLSKGKVYPYTEMKDLPTNASSVLTYIEREFNGGSKFSNGDTLIARITPCLENGKTAFVDYLPEKSIGGGSTEFIVIRSKAGIPLAASYLLARLDDFRRYLILNMSGTSGRQRVPESCLEKFKIAKPTPEIWKSFEKLILPIFQKIRSNSVENETLIKIRDLLLPKLISGEIQLSEVSID